MINNTESILGLKGIKILKNKFLINILFFLLLFSSFVSFIYIFNTQNQKFDIPMFGTINSNMVINIEYPNDEGLSFYIDGIEAPLYRNYKKNTYVSVTDNNSKGKIFSFKTEPNTSVDDIDNIFINLNKNFYYFNNSEIKNFEKNKSEEYVIPNDVVKYSKSSKYPTDKGFGFGLFVFIMSVFFNSKYYVLPLILLGFAVLLYNKNRDNFSFNFKFLSNTAIWWIILSGIFLRIQILNCPYFCEELFCVNSAGNPYAPLAETFSDPGNPPLYFLILRLWTLVFGSSEIATHALSALFSVLTILVVYLFADKFINREVAVLSAFLASVNPTLLHLSQLTRGYSICVFLVILLVFCLFNLVNNPSKKNYLFYTIVAVLNANIHYFNILILFSVFLVGIFLLNSPKEKIKFFLCHILAGLTFLPFFLHTALQYGLMTNFNSYLFLFDLKTNYYILTVYTGSEILANLILILSAALIFSYFIPEFRKFLFYENNSVTNTAFYMLCIMLLLFITAQLFSYFVKPIQLDRYYIILFAVYFIFVSCLMFLPFRNRIIKFLTSSFILLFGIFFFSFSDYKHFWIEQKFIDMPELLTKYSYSNQAQYIKNKNNKVILLYEMTPKSLKFYKDFITDRDVIYTDFSYPLTQNQVEVILKNLNNNVIYIVSQHFDAEWLKNNKNINISMILSEYGYPLYRITKR